MTNEPTLNMVIDQYQKRREGWVNADDSTFYGSFDAGCLKFMFLDNITARCLTKLSTVGGKSYYFDQVKKFCISQGAAMTFCRCGG